MNAIHRAPFIVFEGIEGCGKSTQIARLAARLEAGGRSCLTTREPGGTPLGEALRELLLGWQGSELDGLTELFLLEASRRAHVRQVISPALQAGTTVISDRFADSSMAYQGGGRGLDPELIERLNRIATEGVEPDLTVLLDLAPEEGLRRVRERERGEDRLEREVIDFHRRVREAYLSLARRRDKQRFRVIDANLPADAIHARVCDWAGALL
jgi:dTMP kinase